MSNHRLVYSTDDGDRRRAQPGRKPAQVSTGPALPKDGVVRGLDGDLASLASDLKRHCGSGGSVKGDAIEIQGDHREKVVARLQAEGYRAKLAGG